MKKVVSLILVLAMLMSFMTIAYAADFEFEMYLFDADMENEVAEVNVDDLVYLNIASSTKCEQFGIEIAFDNTALEVAPYDGGYDIVMDHTGDMVVKEGYITVGGVAAPRAKAIDIWIGLIAKKAGTYTITFKGQQDDNMPAGSTSTLVTDPITVVVKGDEPEVPTAESIGLKTDDTQILRLKDVKVNNDNGESYTVNTALGFVSCVNKDANATDLYTQINLEGWAGAPLDINAKNTTEIGDKIYFVAAVTSIREANLNKAFSAKAFATVDGKPVTDSNTVSATYNVQ